MTPAHIQLDVPPVLPTLFPHALWLRIAIMLVGWFALVVIASSLAAVVALWVTGFLG